eukprot:m.58561 g.58561  ORF g.58561 m.58561 type:complete len:115 (-) comp6912_c0_seq2:363-707(-)
MAAMAAMLKQHLADAQARADTAEATLRAQRRIQARLEKDLAAAGGGARAGPTELERRVRDLEEKLAIQVDDNDALKETLRAAIGAKEDEIALLHSVMAETRRVYSQYMERAQQA